MQPKILTEGVIIIKKSLTAVADLILMTSHWKNQTIEKQDKK